MDRPASPLTTCGCPVDQEAWDESVVAEAEAELAEQGPAAIERSDQALADAEKWLAARLFQAEDSDEEPWPSRLTSTPEPSRLTPAAPAAPAGDALRWKLEADGGEESARRWLAGLPAEQRGWVSHLQYESGLRQMEEVVALRAPPVFSDARRGAGIELGRPGTSWEANQTAEVPGGRCATTAVVMRGGVHRAKFTVQKCSDSMLFGVIRPGSVLSSDGSGRPQFPVENGKNPHCAPFDDPHSCDGHCFYLTGSGLRCLGSGWKGKAGGGDWQAAPWEPWEGMEPAAVFETITLVLDLDAGTMNVWKKGIAARGGAEEAAAAKITAEGQSGGSQWLGVMATGLTGEYSWAVSLGGKGDSARIESAIPEPETQPPTLLERSSWGMSADALASGIYAQCGGSDSLTNCEIYDSRQQVSMYGDLISKPNVRADLDPELDHQDNRVLVPGCADLSDEMIEQLFRQRQEQQQQRQRRSVRRQRQPGRQQRRRPEQQLLVGRPSSGGATQTTMDAAQAYAAKMVLRPGW